MGLPENPEGCEFCVSADTLVETDAAESMHDVEEKGERVVPPGKTVVVSRVLTRILVGKSEIVV